ncbi:MAG: flagellar basal body P-ring formation chaperone FlgA [Candidatus Sedimenticola sp. (ex Thyasira tokunagai)]
MFSIRFLIGVMLLGIGGHAMSSAGALVNIDLKVRTEVNRQEFMLSDIAYVSSDDLELQEKVSKAVIGRSPRVGYQGNFNKSLIQSRIEHCFPDLGSRIQWLGGEQVTVKTLGKLFSKDRYINGAKQYLTHQLNNMYDIAKVENYGVYKDLPVPSGQISTTYHVNNLEKIGKRVAVWVEIFVDSERIQSLPVWFKAKVYGQMLSLKHDLNVGVLISKDMFVSEYGELAEVKGTVMTALPSSVMRLKQGMKGGDILVKEIIEKAPAVAKGSRVKILTSTDAVDLTVFATALQDGDIGEKVRVQQGAKGVRYSAKVIARNTLTVDGVSQ